MLCVVFFSIAVVNLGYTTYPQNITQMTAGQSFYIDLGNQTNVKSMLILLNVGALNATISTGSPGNWIEAINVTWTYSNGGWSEDYNKYVSSNGQNEIPIDQNYSVPESRHRYRRL